MSKSSRASGAELEATLRPAGKGKRLVIENGAGAEVKAGLAAMITEAFAIRNQLLSGSDASIEAMSGRLGMNDAVEKGLRNGLNDDSC